MNNFFGCIANKIPFQVVDLFKSGMRSKFGVLELKTDPIFNAGCAEFIYQPLDWAADATATVHFS